ncbi:lecithin retinol acyltransferase family protein [Bowmanella denitrificans]|uniref:Lecithin retinol acyltransferase family protein n=1 Tax=Bowmanella denitrificans TaxID=366582 RepID=A0ABN0WQY6_9ALTE
MPIPLVWLGLGLGALAAGRSLHKASQQSVLHHPGDFTETVIPQNGAVVCCGVFGIFDHTGIWMDGSIIELNGNGLVRAISPQRFLENRSGDLIYVACADDGTVLGDEQIASRAVARVFEYADYHLLRNNCHRFVLSCCDPLAEHITLFSELNQNLTRHYARQISWRPALI